MIHNLTNGWTIQRAFYLLAGLGMVAVSVVDKQWAGILFGGYFMAMGLFAFGCAAGQCATGPDHKERQGQHQDLP